MFLKLKLCTNLFTLNQEASTKEILKTGKDVMFRFLIKYSFPVISNQSLL